MFCIVGLLLSLLFPSLSLSKKLLLADVDLLYLSQGLLTNGRRSEPVPQLLCLERKGSLPCRPDYLVTSAKCTNLNSKARGGIWNSVAKWQCEAVLPGDYSLDRIDISCEGYDYPKDAYILNGSCGMEYSLTYSSTFSSSFSSKSSSSSPSSSRSLSEGTRYTIIQKFMVALIIALLAAAAYLFWEGYQQKKKEKQRREEQQCYSQQQSYHRPPSYTSDFDDPRYRPSGMNENDYQKYKQESQTYSSPQTPQNSYGNNYSGSSSGIMNRLKLPLLYTAFRSRRSPYAPTHSTPTSTTSRSRYTPSYSSSSRYTSPPHISTATTVGTKRR